MTTARPTETETETQTSERLTMSGFTFGTLTEPQFMALALAVQHGEVHAGRTRGFDWGSTRTVAASALHALAKRGLVRVGYTLGTGSLYALPIGGAS